jgi:hypothetical protein
MRPARFLTWQRLTPAFAHRPRRMSYPLSRRKTGSGTAAGHCGGRLRAIATVHDPAVVRTILAHLSRANAPDPPGPAPPAPLALS